MVPVGVHGMLLPMCVSSRLLSCSPAIFRFLFPDPRPSTGTRSTTRFHGARHAGQQPFSDEPALTIGSISRGGNVAKWAPGKANVGMVQTLRLFLPSGLFRSAGSANLR